MDMKEILNWLVDPKLLAAVGGYLSYRYMGKGQSGYKPWLYAGGGAVAGYLIGRAAQSFLVQPTGVQPAAGMGYALGGRPAGLPADQAAMQAELRRMIAEGEAAQRGDRMIDLDAAARRLPAAQAALEANASDAGGSYKQAPPISPVDRQRVAMDTASIAAEDMAILDSAGSYGDSLNGEGLGSFGGDDVDAAVDLAIKEEKGKRGQA